MNIPYLYLDIITFIKEHVYFARKYNNLIVPDDKYNYYYRYNSITCYYIIYI